jgi:LPXTG-motif cell wall-anchored protein
MIEQHVHAPAGGSVVGAVARPRLRMMALLLLTSVAMLTAGSTAAFAQYPPAQDFSVSCTDAVPGQTVTCSIVGALSGESLTVTARYGSVQVLDTVLTADGDGQAEFSFEIPIDAAGATLNIRVMGESSGMTGVVLNVARSVPTGPRVPDARTIPRTGQDLLLLGGAGVLLVGAGAVALLRRRASTSERIDA